MKYCKTCKILYRTPLNRCLFCNNLLDNQINTDGLNPELSYRYPPISQHSKKKQTTKKILYFLLAIGSLVCLLVNLFVKITSKTPTKFWSYYVILSCMLGAYILHEFSISTKIYSKIYKISFVTFLYLIPIALLGSDYHWALDYVFPLGLFALNIISTLCILGSKQRLKQYSIYVICTCLFSYIPLLLYFIKVVNVGWPALTCCLYGILTLLGLFVFSTKQSKEELRKRLHI